MCVCVLLCRGDRQPTIRLDHDLKSLLVRISLMVVDLFVYVLKVATQMLLANECL